jgi:peptidoglycan/xylan/chitin deacetylase (PgdA/CDA1 family)
VKHSQKNAWKPSAIIKWSVLVHAAAGIGFIVESSAFFFWFGAILANQAVLIISGLLPRSKLLGPNITRLPESAIAKRQVALTFDDGPDSIVTPQILDILEKHQAKATFFCVGIRAKKHPELIRRITAQGHQVENHSYSHKPTFAFNGIKGISTEIARTQEVLEKLTGKCPRFFRPIAGIRSPLLDPVLSKHGMRLVSWSRRGFDTQLKDPRRLCRWLTKELTPGIILMLHDGNTARTKEGVAVSVACLSNILQSIANAGLTTVTLDEAFNESHQ